MTHIKTFLSAVYGLFHVLVLCPLAGALSAFGDAIKPHTQRIARGSFAGYRAVAVVLTLIVTPLVLIGALAEAWYAAKREWVDEMDDLGVRFSRDY